MFSEFPSKDQATETRFLGTGSYYTDLPQHIHHEFVGDIGGPLEDASILPGTVANWAQCEGTVHTAALSPLGQQPEPVIPYHSPDISF